MKALLLIAVFSAVALANKDYDAMFREFKATHLKAYADEAEEAQRFKNFVRNMRKAEVLQAANPLAEFGANQFADMSDEEFAPRTGSSEQLRAAKALLSTRPKVTATAAERASAAGKDIDWRQWGIVTEVKDQGSCSAGWAFATTGAMEGEWALADKELTALSDQQLVSCTPPRASLAAGAAEGFGCRGGAVAPAVKRLISENDGRVVTMSSMPFTSGNGTDPGSCPSQEDLDKLPVGGIVVDFDQLEGDEEEMAFFSSQGPITVAIDGTVLQTYKGGVVTTSIANELNHVVLVVGYNDAYVPPYWILKNSWGARWGEGGYFRLAKGRNLCLIADQVTRLRVAN